MPHNEQQPDIPPPRLLNRGTIVDIFERVRRYVAGGGETRIGVRAWWRGELRWARNRVSLASDRRDVAISVMRGMHGAWVAKSTNQLDEAELVRIIRAAERETALAPRGVNLPEIDLPAPVLPYPQAAIWSDATYNVTAAQRGEIARTLAGIAEPEGMLSAGYLEVRAYESMSFNFGADDSAFPYPPTDSANRPPHAADGSIDTSDDLASRSKDGAYLRYTQAQCSMTVRHPKGTGSGWAGGSSFDWSAIDRSTLADRALKKCLASIDPVSVEPGRFTVILEPQAVAALVGSLVESLSRVAAEDGQGPFASQFDPSVDLWHSKLGMRVVDERVTIRHDPMHPDLGVLPFAGLAPVTWIERGILTNLSYDRNYALRSLNDNVGNPVRGGSSGHPSSFSMEGGSSSMEEMIASTVRGVLVTRFSQVNPIGGNSILVNGLTRDGLWLIEKGKIVKAIRNMYFVDSPLFVLNQLDQLGPAAPVFSPLEDGLAPAIVPSLKSRDFAFTAVADAI